jgi:hypothetical protein
MESYRQHDPLTARRRADGLRTGCRERGITIWGMLVMAAVIGFLALLAIKLIPPYLQHGKAIVALRNAVNQSGGASSESAEELRRALQRRFDIEDIRHINPQRDLRFERRRPGYVTVRLAYEVRVPIAYNVSALIEFDESVETRSN